MDVQCTRCFKSIDITEANRCEHCDGDLFCDNCYTKFHMRHNELDEADAEWVLSDSRRLT